MLNLVPTALAKAVLVEPLEVEVVVEVLKVEATEVGEVVVLSQLQPSVVETGGVVTGDVVVVDAAPVLIFS